MFQTWHRLVLSVRGSCEWSAVLTDVAAEESLLAGGLAHSGMARAARHLLGRKRNGEKNGGCLGILDHRVGFFDKSSGLKKNCTP